MSLLNDVAAGRAALNCPTWCDYEPHEHDVQLAERNGRLALTYAHEKSFGNAGHMFSDVWLGVGAPEVDSVRFALDCTRRERMSVEELREMAASLLKAATAMQDAE